MISFPPLHPDEPVTVAVLNYNGKQDLADAIRSVQQSAYQPAEILVVDDGSTDGSPSFVRANFPEVRVVEMGRNTKMLNQVRNRALQEARTRLVFLMDHDVTLRPDCLTVLVAHMQELPDAAVLTTRAVYQHDPNQIYVDSQRMHFLCNSVALYRDAGLEAADDQPRPSFGWGTQLIDKAKAARVGFFDEDYVMGWGDDGEFHHKVHLAGLGCYSIPKAVVSHKRTEGAGRIYGGLRNRWYLIIETYALKTIILTLPALMMYEVATFALLFVRNEWRHYIRAVQDTFKDRKRLLAKRAKIKTLRLVPDRELLFSGTIFIRGEFTEKPYLKAGKSILNTIFSMYYLLIRRFL